MSWADYQRHLAEGQQALGRVDARAVANNHQSALLYAIAHLLAALAAVQDPGGGLIEFRGEEDATRTD